MTKMYSVFYRYNEGPKKEVSYDEEPVRMEKAMRLLSELVEEYGEDLLSFSIRDTKMTNRTKVKSVYEVII